MTITAFKALHQRRQAEHLARHGHPPGRAPRRQLRPDAVCRGGLLRRNLAQPRRGAILFIHVFQKPAGLGDYLRLVQLPANL